MPLLTPDQILKLDQGECVFINAAYRGRGEASVPLQLKVRIPQKEQQIQQRSEALWTRQVRSQLIQRCQQQPSLTDLNPENETRQAMAERLFPKPVGQHTDVSGALTADTDITEDEFDEVFR